MPVETTSNNNLEIYGIRSPLSFLFTLILRRIAYIYRLLLFGEKRTVLTSRSIL